MKRKKPCILIADGSEELLQSLKNCKEAKGYHIEMAQSGRECLDKLEKVCPELIVVDFMLPGMHGIEILSAVRKAPLMKKVGVIITSYHSMIQNYHVAIQMGANYCLDKPYTAKKLFSLIERFFEGTLTPSPFLEKKKPKHPSAHHQKGDRAPHNSYIKFWGTRGSNPVAGPEYIRFGGNTCCLEVRDDKDLVIIDAGTGIRSLGATLPHENLKTYNVLFSHTHWDHLLGFPFFHPIYHEQSEVHLWAPVGFDKTTKELFSEMLAYSYFPVALDDIKSKILFKDIRDSEKLSFGKIKIFTHYSFHPGSSLCFKIHIAGKVIGYVTDNEFLFGYKGSFQKMLKDKELIEPYASFINFFKGCDLMIHEAQYSDEEYVQREGWGHSSLSNAAAFIKLASIKDWVVTHHDPKHTDAELLESAEKLKTILQDMKHPCQVRMAYDGMLIPF